MTLKPVSSRPLYSLGAINSHPPQQPLLFFPLSLNVRKQKLQVVTLPRNSQRFFSFKSLRFLKPLSLYKEPILEAPSSKITKKNKTKFTNTQVPVLVV